MVARFDGSGNVSRVVSNYKDPNSSFCFVSGGRLQRDKTTRWAQPFVAIFTAASRRRCGGIDLESLCLSIGDTFANH
jgi:hypothetical protein